MLAVHRAWRGDGLAGGLAELLRDPLDDPFTPEVVAVPTRGVERWLTQRLATVLGASAGREDGVCANINFPFPGTLVGTALAAATGIDPDSDPWKPERAVWPLLEVVDACAGEPWLATLAAHLGAGRSARDTPAGGDPGSGGDVRRYRRFATVRHLADLYDRYAVHRPDVLAAWAAGDTGAGVPDDLAWQGQLWRGLRARVGVPSLAERLPDACRRLRHEPDLVDLPGRMSLFGLTRLPASYLDVLVALGEHRAVHLWLLHPSPALWDRASVQARNPILATWGRDAREMQLVLAAAGVAGGTELPGPADPDTEHAATLLGRIQADIREDRAPPIPAISPDAADRRPELDPSDRSLQVHACHGPARQVEVLRDAIFHLLADDPTLEPRHIIVMCPDIDAFAPLIGATFGTTQELGLGGDLHVRLADRSIRQTNPVLGAVSALLDLAGSRVKASAVLDLAGREPVRRRFRFDDDDLAQVDEWARAVGVRWGMDAAGRAAYKLDRLPAGTWAAGVDRLLLGVAMSEDGLRTVGGVLPFDDIDSGDIELVGRVAELVDRLRVVLAELSADHTIHGWAEAIDRAAGVLFATTDADAWQTAQLRALLDDVVASAGAPAGASADDGGSAVLALPEVRALLAERLRGQPTRANFRTGHLTMCTLVPMRSVPHRVVCVMGLDDGVFPRHAAPDGDDLTARERRVGDRDSRSEDRQLLLDAVLAAEEHLVITYTGRDPRTNAVRPPAVPLGELLDVIDRTVRVAGGTPREQVVVRHPLQPFDPRNFAAGTLGTDEAWSFDPVNLAGSQASLEARRRSRVLDGIPLPPAPRNPVELDRLVQFVEHPVRAFLRQRLGAVLGRDSEDPGDALPLEMDPLERWTVGDRMLRRRLAGLDVDRCRRAELASGALPPGTLGDRILDQLGPRVEELVRTAGLVVDRTAEPETVDVTVELPGGRFLVGSVSGCVDDVLLAVTYSQLAAKHRLAAWVRLLALNAAHPERSWTARSIGRGPSAAQPVRVATAVLHADDPAARRAEAVELLAGVVDLYDRGLREPLPLWAKTSAAWAAAATAGNEGALVARGLWKADGDFPGEDSDAEHQLVYEGVAPFADLAALEPAADESGPGWYEDEPTRAGRLALRLWAPLLEREHCT